MKRYRVKLTAFLLSAAILLPLAACGSAEPEPEAAEPVSEEPAEPLTYHIYVE